MKNIILRMPRVIGGVVRQPAEGAIPVADEIAEQLILEDLADDADEEVDDGLDGEKVADLKKVASDEGVDLGTANSKAEIIAAVRAHRAAQAE